MTTPIFFDGTATGYTGIFVTFELAASARLYQRRTYTPCLKKDPWH